MRLTITTQPANIIRGRYRRGAIDNPFYTEFFSTNNNKFYPFYLIHTLYARTKKEIVYRVPWTNNMISTQGGWANVKTSLEQSPIMRPVVINGRLTTISVCKGFACEVTSSGGIKPLFIVATPNLEELFDIGKRKTVNQQEFYLLQSKDFLEDNAYKNLRSQLRKIYINPLLNTGMDTIISHDLNSLVFNPIKLQMKFGSTEDMVEQLEILKKSVCPKEAPVKIKVTSEHEADRSDMFAKWSTSGTSPVDGTIQYDKDSGMRVWSEVMQQWSLIEGSSITSSLSSPSVSSDLLQSPDRPESTVVEDENAFINRIMNERANTNNDDEPPF